MKPLYLVTYEEEDGVRIIGLFKTKPSKKDLRIIFKDFFEKDDEADVQTEEDLKMWAMLASVNKLIPQDVP